MQGKEAYAALLAGKTVVDPAGDKWRAVNGRLEYYVGGSWTDAADDETPLTYCPYGHWSLLGSGAPDHIAEVLADLGDFLRSKQAGYGESVTRPVRVFAPEADATASIRARIDDKLSRLVRGADTMDVEAKEDTLKDLVGYWVMWQVAKREAGGE